ncbi:MAG: DinB family protein [Bacteroidota bacterium]|nr:DinB family protein [Bacteroidota bacterium]MDP4216708.1 DinB family protein [Bacteroidota bacterium]MDP4245966.1 DinB family protein [Bacteroidota bacterium]MDP4253593.1 DinB family protein [Bacteroidota bacterium]MDP4257252.1 DinB family protein [Bacteroidota bacterium]
MKKTPFIFLLNMLFLGLLLQPHLSFAQDKNNPALKSILLDQYKSTYNVEEWFVPATKAVEGMTAEQATWKGCDSCHSVAQEVTHLIYWNKEALARFRGEKPDPFGGDNSKTFVNVDKAQWTAIVAQLDQVLGDIQRFIEQTDEAKLKQWYSGISHVSTHNAYHTGQILFIRKMQGSWKR